MQGKDGRRTNFSELYGVWIKLQSKDVSHATLRKTLTDPEFLQCLKGNHLRPRQKKGQVMPHTLHLCEKVQQKNPKGSTLKKAKPQRMACDFKNRKREKMTKQMETTTVAQPDDGEEEKRVTRTKTVQTAQASIPQLFHKSREQHTQKDLEQGLWRRKGNATVHRRNNKWQRGELNMILRGTQGEQNTSKLDKDNGDRRNYPLARSKSGIPRYHNPPCILDPSHGYPNRDTHPLLSELRSPQLDQLPLTESWHSLKTDGSPKQWKGFDTEQELQKILETNIPSHDQDKTKELIQHQCLDQTAHQDRGLASSQKRNYGNFLKTVIPHDGHNKGQDHKETDPVTNCYTRMDPRDSHAQDKQQD